jgi:hypothetical protein
MIEFEIKVLEPIVFKRFSFGWSMFESFMGNINAG